jgi:3-methyladenine DNA glycosylase AlkD
MKKDSLVLKVRDELKTHADEKTKNTFQRFFKEKAKFHGVKSAIVVKIAKANFPRVKKPGKKEVFDLCELFLRSGYSEEAWIAANWVYRVNKDYERNDLKVFEKWIDKYTDNWAKCDTLCNHAVGALIEKYPDLIINLKKWAKSQNLWLRRAAAVSLIIPAKQGKFLKEIFEIADILLRDEKDLAQKGYGWMLKEASRKHQNEVFNYVMKNKKGMPRAALRYAIEKMPPDLRKKAMGK